MRKGAYDHERTQRCRGIHLGPIFHPGRRLGDEELIMSLLAGLAVYVRKGDPLTVRQSYVTFSGSQEIMTKFISKTERVGEWSKETKQILSALKKKC
jgi:hypothetical protein